MAIFDSHHPLAFTFGLIGNFISFLVYFAPLPTFIRIYRRKSTEGFQSLPYVVALFSAMLWLYYGLLKSSDAAFIISINSFGCIIETIYIAMYIAYAPREARNLTAKLLVSLNLGLFSLILLLTHFLVKGSIRAQVLGWICAAISVSVFAAPLSIMAQVIRTRSIEFMPFTLSFSLTLSAIVWFSYGLFLKDLYVALPNILGFIFGILQMVLYGIYRNAKKVTEDKKRPEHIINIVTLSTLGTSEVHPVDAQPDGSDNEKEYEQRDDLDKSVASTPDEIQTNECAD